MARSCSLAPRLGPPLGGTLRAACPVPAVGQVRPPPGAQWNARYSMRPSGRPAAVRSLCSPRRGLVGPGARVPVGGGVSAPQPSGPGLFPAARGGWPAATAPLSRAAPSRAREDTARALPVPCCAPVRPQGGPGPPGRVPPLLGKAFCAAASSMRRGWPRLWRVMGRFPAPCAKGKVKRLGQGKKGFKGHFWPF